METSSIRTKMHILQFANFGSLKQVIQNLKNNYLIDIIDKNFFRVCKFYFGILKIILVNELILDNFTLGSVLLNT